LIAATIQQGEKQYGLSRGFSEADAGFAAFPAGGVRVERA
jgi:hypothetical protein